MKVGMISADASQQEAQHVVHRADRAPRRVAAAICGRSRRDCLLQVDAVELVRPNGLIL